MAIGAVVALGALTAYTVWKVRERRRAMASTSKTARGREILGYVETGVHTFAIYPSPDGLWEWSINGKAQQGKEATRTEAFATALEYWLPTVPADVTIEFLLGPYEAAVRPAGDGTYTWSINGPATKTIDVVEENPKRGPALLAALRYLEDSKGQKP